MTGTSVTRKDLIVAAFSVLLGTTGGIAAASVEIVSTAPDSLKVSSGETLAQVAHAIGYQIYACTARNDQTGFEWVLKAPEADLFDHAGKTLGKHYAGPTWESVDGSKVVGELKARADSPDGQSIPWLLLKAKSRAGEGRFAAVTSIQRIETVGGNPPVQACDQTQRGEVSRVPYAATYLFYASTARGNETRESQIDY